jgi:GTP-binding protein Era
MNKNIFSALEGSDLILYVTDVKEKNINNKIIEIIAKKEVPVILVVNKKDLDENFNLKSIKGTFLHKYLISTKNKKNINKLIQSIVENLPEHPAYYSSDELTDKNERFLVSEIVREKIFELFSQEIPYSTHVEVTLFKNEEDILRIEGYVYTESESQKSILIGKKGIMIRKFSEAARLKIENIYTKKVFINFTVKVRKWRNDNTFINEKM